MKKNKINPLEAHFEKLILVAVSAVLLAVVAMQFLTQPNAVKVGTNPTPMAPDRVFDPIERDAEALLAQMQNSSPTLPDVPDQNVAVQFAEVSNLAIADTIRLSVMGKGVDLEAADIGPSGSDAVTTYVMPALPVPASLAAATHRATIDPYTAVTNKELRAYLPKEQPFDTVAVSVEGTISGETLLASLQEDPDGDSGPMSQLPLTWWRGNMELLGVEVQREELSSGGSWTGSTVITGVPGRQSLLGEARRDAITAAELVDVARSAQSVMRDIAQPAFPQTVAGPDWVRPSELSEDAGMTDEERDIARLKRQYDSLVKRRDGIQLQMENVGGSTSGGNEERGGGGGGRRGGGGEGGQPSPRPTVDRDQQRRDNFQKQIDGINGQLERLATELAALGAPVDGNPNQNTQPNEPEPPLPSLLDAEDLPVWVHDFSAEPGKTYRYRMRVVVNNPLFAKEQFLSDAQKPSAASPTAEGAWSGWTGPVAVESDRHFFVVSGTENDALGNGPRAAVEVYQFYYGYWRKGSTTLEPGDSIHARAKLPENLLLWDLAKLEELGPRTGTGNRPAPGGWREGFEGGPEGGSGDNRRLLNPDRGGDPRQPPQPRTAANAETVLPEGAEKAPDTLDLVHAAMLLDVMPMPGGRDSTRVVLRDAQGRLIARLTDSERSSQFYKRLASNAREGETQGQPELEANNDRQTPPPFDPRRREGEGDPGRGPGGG